MMHIQAMRRTFCTCVRSAAVWRGLHAGNGSSPSGLDSDPPPLAYGNRALAHILRPLPVPRLVCVLPSGQARTFALDACLLGVGGHAPGAKAL